jgi:hypothetical protein
MPDGIVITDENSINYINEQGKNLLDPDLANS